MGQGVRPTTALTNLGVANPARRGPTAGQPKPFGTRPPGVVKHHLAEQGVQVDGHVWNVHRDVTEAGA